MKIFSSLTPRSSVAVLGYYGFGNLGDELLLQACVNLLNANDINNITALSNDPAETQKNFNVNAINRWKIFEVSKTLRSCDYLLLGGGGLFQDSTSVKSCLYYWGVVRLAKFFGVKVLAVGQSIGPLNSRLAKFFTASALRACEKIHVRDQNSFDIAKSLGCKDVELGFDIVMSLETHPAPLTPHPSLVINR
ncbi:MAG: polysaccharide pyruvyl transferase family protein, partial [Synergistaceae bacterium]|nr:polysaccharide pyruvyl transferase family protein [Synergistaceae bacterium]